MFNIGFSEMLILGTLALIFIGPEQLPEIARVVGRFLNEWKRASSELQNHLLREDPPTANPQPPASRSEPPAPVTPAVDEPKIAPPAPASDPEKKE